MLGSLVDRLLWWSLMRLDAEDTVPVYEPAKKLGKGGPVTDRAASASMAVKQL